MIWLDRSLNRIVGFVIDCEPAPGIPYLGDNFIGRGFKGGRFVGHGLFASCLLNVHHIKQLPDLVSLGHAPNHDPRVATITAGAAAQSLTACDLDLTCNLVRVPFGELIAGRAPR